MATGLTAGLAKRWRESMERRVDDVAGVLEELTDEVGAIGEEALLSAGGRNHARELRTKLTEAARLAEQVRGALVPPTSTTGAPPATSATDDELAGRVKAARAVAEKKEDTEPEDTAEFAGATS